MSDQLRRRIRPSPPPPAAGAPNVLSDQATPNRLATAGRGSPTSRPVVANTTAARPVIAAGRPGVPSTTDERIERPRRRPSLGLIIFLGIIFFNAARYFGAGSGSSAPRPTPVQATATARAPVPNTIFGAVTFGTSLGKECGLQSPGTSFAPNAEVWWRADLLQVQAANAAIVVVTFKDERQIDYEYVPPDPSVGKWQVFCAGPAKNDAGGAYRLELWNAERSKLLAKGEFTRTGPKATPAPTGTPVPTRTPAPTATQESAVAPDGTFVVALAGKVAFGTALDGDCALSGIDATFESEDVVWWRAELNQAVPRGANARLFALLDGFILTNELLPAESLVDGRSVVCAWTPTPGVATGYYVVQVWTEDRDIMLANGGFFRETVTGIYGIIGDSRQKEHPMTTVKDDILGRIDSDETAWQALVGEVPAGRVDEPGPMGEWSFRDLVSHLLAWRNRTTSRLQAAAAGAPRPPAPWPAEMTDDDPINGWFRDQDAGRPAADLLDDYARSFASLRGAVAAMPADAFLGETDTPGYFKWRDSAGEIQSDFSGHLADHADDVRAWLAKG